MSSPKERLQKASDDLWNAAEDVNEAIHNNVPGAEGGEKAKLLTEHGLKRVKEAVKEIEEIIR